MRSFVLALSILCLATNGLAQKAKKEPKKVYSVVEAPAPPVIYMHFSQSAEFNGGNSALQKYMYDHLRYPEMALESRIQGTVYVQFFINEEGKVVSLKVIKSNLPKECDEEAIRVIGAMPAWKPSKYDGKPVGWLGVMPVVFKIRER